MKVDRRILEEIALSYGEYLQVIERLGREPNSVELGMIGALWSEHCGYKNSKPLLSLFPTGGPRVLVKAGEENAGAVDIGEGLSIVMKIESHNHPSAIEPYEGAATGVGGIVRDIFAMGARPIALLNSLRFGPLTEPRNRYLFGGVVAGIAGYGNCLGIPDVGGEVFFADTYSGNPLVNAMCVGLVRSDRIISARASEEGHLLLLVGADTGRDGIHGATFASVELSEASQERRPAVQVGNPFLEKLLMEACLELARSDIKVSVQDLGAAGMTSAAIESAAKGGMGIEIDVSKMPQREAGMTPYELMLSESQERMLVIVGADSVDDVKAIFGKWDLHSSVVGRVTGDGKARILDGSEVVADIPISLLTNPPTYRRAGVLSPAVAALQGYDFDSLTDISMNDVASILERLLGSPNIASKESVFRQYDHQVLINTVIGPGSDAAVLRIKGTKMGIALTTDGNGRLCYLEPYAGGAMTVAEAARNLVCVGAEPLALTNCLNFGSPERPEVYYQLEECIKGMSEACRVLGIPVISGNVSLYNESGDSAVYPTPVVGMLGLLDDLERRCSMGFKDEGDIILLLGDDGGVTGNPSGLAGSEYLSLVCGIVAGRPTIDLDKESALQRACLEAIGAGIVKSAHDPSEGGLLVAVAESCIAGGIGADLELHPSDGNRLDEALFGEKPSRIVVSVSPANLGEMETIAMRKGVPVLRLGTAGGDSLYVNREVRVALPILGKAWREGLESLTRNSLSGE
ncbi:MAG: phosphoribosylformylglycinamidine synthase subunit PurL [Dehalococcoidia bacterium]|nr:phosphoribosylformylglycinamidine synthase subunit PurL [Dehalococcoidia bacterium]